MSGTIDYQELIDELKDEVGTGSLKEKEVIQVLRDTVTTAETYKAIVDWYYNKEAMEVELDASDIEDKEEKKELMILRDQYQKDLSSLEEITVQDCLKEMFQHTVKKEKKGKGKGKGNPFF